MPKKSKAAISFVFSAILFIIAFIMIPASKSFESTKVTTYSVDGNHISGENRTTYLSDGIIGGQPNLLDISVIVLCLGIITGTILLLYAIYFLATSKEVAVSATDSSQSPMFVDCPNCGEVNTVKSEYCFKCHKRLTNRPLSHTTGNKWYCPTCGKENQSYVGTCGCGTRKP